MLIVSPSSTSRALLEEAIPARKRSVSRLAKTKMTIGDIGAYVKRVVEGLVDVALRLHCALPTMLFAKPVRPRTAAGDVREITLIEPIRASLATTSR
jgi:hypothetical protein